MGVVSLQWGSFTAHGNFGYFARGGPEQNDAVLATVGFDDLIASAVTLAADLVTQWQSARVPSHCPDRSGSTPRSRPKSD
jgi:hypothetical protein